MLLHGYFQATLLPQAWVNHKKNVCLSVIMAFYNKIIYTSQLHIGSTGQEGTAFHMDASELQCAKPPGFKHKICNRLIYDTTGRNSFFMVLKYRIVTMLLCKVANMLQACVQVVWCTSIACSFHN